MKDRSVQYPRRRRLVPVEGQADIFDVFEEPGTVYEVGTPLNKANLLSDATAALYGLTADNANVDKALARTMQGGLLNALLTEFTKTSDSGDILATDSLLNALNKLNNQSTAVGMYTGNDAETRDISIGFTPRCIIIIANSPAMTGGGIGLAGTGGQGSEMWSGIVAYGYPLNTLSGRDIPIKIVENGFTVGKKDTYYAGQGGTFKNRTNFLNITYNYIALR